MSCVRIKKFLFIPYPTERERERERERDRERERERKKAGIGGIALVWGRGNAIFYIAGIEEFPQSKLTIYNRWGNIVYQVTNYQNDWRGTWKNNQELPDGAYFYLLELNEPNDNRMFRGFLELHR